MKIIFLVLIFTFSLKSNQIKDTLKNISKPIENNVSNIPSSTFYNIVTIGKVEYGSKIDSLPIWKVDAAMNLIDKFTKKFAYFPMKEKAFILDSLNKENIGEPYNHFIKEYDINWIFNFRINKLQNILGVTLNAIKISDSTKVYIDNGFSYLNLKDTSGDQNIYDVALTNAMQRAIAKTLKDSTMFKSAIDEYKTYPFPTLVVGGLEFINSDKFVKWNLFNDKQVTSYDMTESIWEETYNQNRFIAYDIESRDSLYTLFNIYGIENYDKPTPFELKALSQMEVKYFITGTFQRVSSGARIKMHICRVNKSNLDVIVTQEGMVNEDSLDELRKSVKTTTKKLIDKFREKNG